MTISPIERQVHVDASPEIVFDVISSPEHIREWWNGAETDISPVVGSVAEIAWGKGSAEPHVEQLTVVTADPPRTFAFRWVRGDAAEATADNSLVVTFELVPQGGGTLIHLTESGFDEKSWDDATREAAHADHVNGWDVFVPSLGAYVARLVSTT